MSSPITFTLVEGSDPSRPCGRTVHKVPKHREIEKGAIPCKLTSLPRPKTKGRQTHGVTFAGVRKNRQPGRHTTKARTALQETEDQLQSYIRSEFNHYLERKYGYEDYGASLGYIWNPVAKKRQVFVIDPFTGRARPRQMKDDMWCRMSQEELAAHREQWLSGELSTSDDTDDDLGAESNISDGETGDDTDNSGDDTDNGETRRDENCYRPIPLHGEVDDDEEDEPPVQQPENKQTQQVWELREQFRRDERERRERQQAERIQQGLL
ncbi:hypothetical protein F4781DRAFT_398367 [Annulohypoxylon bovei var. microspora]|nr:hypothetical protein F4781DRAFT_398367 [Annulohypoxylon bovei var. microspora]